MACKLFYWQGKSHIFSWKKNHKYWSENNIDHWSSAFQCRAKWNQIYRISVLPHSVIYAYSLSSSKVNYPYKGNGFTTKSSCAIIKLVDFLCIGDTKHKDMQLRCRIACEYTLWAYLLLHPKLNTWDLPSVCYCVTSVKYAIRQLGNDKW